MMGKWNSFASKSIYEMIAKISKLLGNPERIRCGSSALNDSYYKFSKNRESSTFQWEDRKAGSITKDSTVH